MMQSRAFLATALTGLGLTFAAFSASAVQGNARPEIGADLAADRIAAAFAAAPAVEVAPAIEIAASRVGKGDLLVSPPCSAQKWPFIAAGCLVMTDGSAAPLNRTATVGYQAGPSTTVLVRMPAPQVASR
jgi:hypothetical protein